MLEANIYGAVKVANTDSITEDSVVGDNTQVSTTFFGHHSIFSVSADLVQQGYYNMEDSATPEVESTDFNDVIIDGAQVSVTSIIIYCIIVSAD